MVCGTGADANVILLRDGVLLGEDALFTLVVKLHGAAKVSAGLRIAECGVCN